VNAAPIIEPQLTPELPAGVSNARRWAVVWLLFIASLINYFDRATISFALPLISRDLRLGEETKGVLLSAFFWSYTLMQLPVGLMADRLDLLWLYAGAFALWSLAQGLTGLAGSFAVLIALRIALGVGESIYLPGGTTIVSRLFGRAERGLPSGIFDFGTRTGLVVEGLLIPWLLSRFGWRTTFVIVGATALIWLAPWFAVFPSRAMRRNRGTQVARPGTSAPNSTFLFNRNLLGICLGFFCFDYFWYLMLTWLPDYLFEVRHMSIIKAGLFASLPYAVFGLCEPAGGWIADRLIRHGWDETLTRKGIISIAFLFGLLMIPAARARTANEAMVFIIGSGLVGLATGNLIVILQSCAPSGQVGIWTGFENFAGNIGGITAPLITGFLVARTGSFLSAFILGPAILVSGLASYWFVVGPLGPAPDVAVGRRANQ
jgi:MFS transporter, ACS family, D-galactonate transporter